MIFMGKSFSCSASFMGDVHGVNIFGRMSMGTDITKALRSTEVVQRLTRLR